MPGERRRNARQPFGGAIEVVSLLSGRMLIAPARDLSLEGVFVRTRTPFLQGEKVKIRISHGGAELTAVGTVAFSRPDEGMGISFASVEPTGHAVLRKWMLELAGQDSIRVNSHQG